MRIHAKRSPQLNSRAHSDPMESDWRSRFLCHRIFFDEPASTSSENALDQPFLWGEDHIDPVVGVAIGAIGKVGSCAVNVNTIVGSGGCQCPIGTVVLGCKEATLCDVIIFRMVGGDVDGVG